MKIMVLSDIADKALWDYLDRRLLEGIDLILSCGDLPAEYLSFLTCFTDAPILYVHGNHDKGYDRKPPEGCVCVEDDICVVNGVRVLGLGGSMRYRPKEPYMHTEQQMARRARRLWWKLHKHKGFDILLAHAQERHGAFESRFDIRLIASFGHGIDLDLQLFHRREPRKDRPWRHTELCGNFARRHRIDSFLAHDFESRCHNLLFLKLDLWRHKHDPFV